MDFDILGLKIKNVNFEEVFDFNENDYKRIKNLNIFKTKEKIVIIHTSSAWIMKLWSNDKWTELIKRINASEKYRFVFIGTKEEKEDFQEISKKLDFRIYSLINKLNLCDLMLVLRSSNYLIGIDSGPKNMAYLADLRSITLLGPSGHLYKPFNNKDEVIDKSNAWDLYETFFYKKNRFVQSITVDEVFNAFKRLVKNKPTTRYSSHHWKSRISATE